jgi:hypothetical protein
VTDDNSSKLYGAAGSIGSSNDRMGAIARVNYGVDESIGATATAYWMLPPSILDDLVGDRFDITFTLSYDMRAYLETGRDDNHAANVRAFLYFSQGSSILCGDCPEYVVSIDNDDQRDVVHSGELTHTLTVTRERFDEPIRMQLSLSCNVWGSDTLINSIDKSVCDAYEDSLDRQNGIGWSRPQIEIAAS